MSVVSTGSGAGITVVAGATAVAVLPNTGQLSIVNLLGQVSMAVGGVVLVTTVARAIAKRSYNQ